MNLAAMILRQADLSHDRLAFAFEGETYNYGEFARRARTRAALFRKQGVCVGDRVGLLGFNQPGFFETMIAANALGAVFVPPNFRLPG